MPVSEDTKIQNRSLDLAFGLLVALLNIIEMYILIARVKKRKNYENILLSLSVADLLFGLSNAIVCAIFLADVEKNVLNVFYFSFYFFVTTSILHLTLINIDRLWTVFRPIKHKIYFTHKRVRQALVVVWAIGIIVSVVLLLTNELTDTFKTITRTVRRRNATIAVSRMNSTAGQAMLNGTRRLIRQQRRNNTIVTTIDIQKDINNFGSEMKTAVAILILVADVGFILCNTAIVYLLSRKKKIQTNSLSSRNTERKVSIICVVVTLTFVLFTMPYAFCKLSTNSVPVWANILLVVNSGMNSIIYFFRARIERFFGRWFKDGDDSTASSSGLQNSSSTAVGSQAGTPMPLMKREKKWKLFNALKKMK